MNIIYKFNFFLFIILVSIFSLSYTFSYAQSVDDKRNEAIKLYNDGEIKKSIILLKSIAKEHRDTSSMLALGRIYLKIKNSDKAFYWINNAALECDKSAISSLRIFYQNKSSKYFDPYKYAQMTRNCLPKPDKKYSDQRPHKKNKQTNKTIRSNEYNKIDENVAELWGKIAQIEGKYVAHGTGFSILSNGYFLTNFHVIDRCNSIGIRYNNLYGKASLINFNENLDIALLKVNAPTPFYAKFDSEKYIAGEEIFVAGYPVPELFGTKMSVRKGSITSPQVKNFGNRRGRILIDASIASGNSGGPVVNKYGSIRGIVSGGLSEKWIKKFEEKGILIGNSTFGLMISGNLVKLWLDEINIKTHNVIVNASKRDTDTIGTIAEKFTAIIECYER